MTKYSGTPSTMKKINSDAVLNAIKQNPSITKPQLSKLLNISLPTINKLVIELELQQYVIAGNYAESTGGRPARTYIFNENRNYIISIYIVNSKYHLVVANSDGCEIESMVIKHETKKDWSKELTEIIQGVLTQYKEKKIKAVGIAVPGAVDDGYLHKVPSIAEWEGFNLKEYLSERFDIPILLENDIKMATMGIYRKYRQSTPIDNMVFLYIDEGIGAGIVINGKLYSGKKNLSGELSLLQIGKDSAEQMLKNAIKKKDHKLFVELVNVILNNIICMVEPELIAIACDELCSSDAIELRKRLTESISERFLPDIVLEKVDIQNLAHGLTFNCLETVEAMLRLVD